jgi:hypothetical protein
VPGNACFFNTPTNFSCVKICGPASAHYFIAPPPPTCHLCLPISVSWANLIFTNNCLVFQMFPMRRTPGSGYIKTLKKLPLFEELVVISLLQIVFVYHGLYISKYGYLIFLRIVIMNLNNRHDTQQGFVRFIIPAQQRSTSLVSDRSSQDSTQSSSVYLPPSWWGGGWGATFKIRLQPKSK